LPVAVLQLLNVYEERAKEEAAERALAASFSSGAPRHSNADAGTRKAVQQQQTEGRRQQQSNKVKLGFRERQASGASWGDLL
jgi:hypothetical protein